MTGRKGENSAVHFRTDRIQYVNGAWYFCIREKPDLMGPYSTKADAELAIRLFIRDILNGASPERAFANHLLADRLSLI